MKVGAYVDIVGGPLKGRHGLVLAIHSTGRARVRLIDEASADAPAYKAGMSVLVDPGEYKLRTTAAKPAVSVGPDADRLCDYLAAFGRAYIKADEAVNNKGRMKSDRAEALLNDAAELVLEHLLCRKPTKEEVERSMRP